MTVLNTPRQDYDAYFKCDEGIQKTAWEKAWATRNFEIEMYWKRAMYFWAFIASTFAGLLAVKGADNYVTNKLYSAEYLLICIGIILSFSWVLVNKGSKVWQKNWETHIDLLEDEISGPLYKTVLFEDSFSVSKINLWISHLFVGVWVILGIEFWRSKYSIIYEDHNVILYSGATFLFCVTMYISLKVKTNKKEEERRMTTRLYRLK